jgi:hypothetical protein
MLWQDLNKSSRRQVVCDVELGKPDHARTFEGEVAKQLALRRIDLASHVDPDQCAVIELKGPHVPVALEAEAETGQIA